MQEDYWKKELKEYFVKKCENNFSEFFSTNCEMLLYKTLQAEPDLWIEFPVLLQLLSISSTFIQAREQSVQCTMGPKP